MRFDMSVRIANHIRRGVKEIQKEAKKEVTRKALRVEANAKKSMRGGGKPHTPSKPGQPPRVDTGRLRASITHEVHEGFLTVTARVGTNVKYAIFLEFGTSKMAARPFLRPALDAVRE